MSFDPTTITEVLPPVPTQGHLWLSWKTTAPAGTYFQVYIQQKLTWWGTSTYCSVPVPSSAVRIDIGSVGSGQQTTDFSSTLAPTPDNKALLSWLGGTYLDSTGNNNVAAFHVYGSSSPGGSVNYGSMLATIPIDPSDGFGLGGFGQGGFGRSAGTYSWESGPLDSGTWQFAVKTVDLYGNEGTASTSTIVIVGPPNPPARNAAGQRLTYTYNPSTYKVTMNWLASPV